MTGHFQRKPNQQQLVDYPAKPDIQAVGLPTVETKEQTLWHGRPFLSLRDRYVITSERLKIIRGILARKVENYELIRIQDIDYRQTIGKRIFGIGDISIRGQNPSNLQITLRNVRKPEKVSEILRRGWLDARSRYGLQFWENM